MGDQESLIETQRFGRYLRKIREERRLSLDAVEELSFGFPERVTKSHLSRIENGQAVPTFTRMFALSQIYGIPVTSLAERFEIELWREMTPNEAAGRSSEEILAEVERLKLAGKYVERLMLITSALDGFGDGAQKPSPVVVQQLQGCQIDSLIHLERYETAKIECEVLLSATAIDPEIRFRALLALATCCYRLKRFTIAHMALEEASKRLDALQPSPRLRADLEAHRAMVFYALGNIEQAAECFEKTAALYDAVSEPFERCRAIVNQGQALLDRHEHKRAETLLKGVLKTVQSAGYDRLQSLALSHLGVAASLNGLDDEAESYFLQSNQIARTREYLSLVFRNCYHLWNIAVRRGDETSAKANEKTLRTYLSRVDNSLAEAQAFRDYLSRGQDA